MVVEVVDSPAGWTAVGLVTAAAAVVVVGVSSFFERGISVGVVAFRVALEPLPLVSYEGLW